jgi:hypothetical protein
MHSEQILRELVNLGTINRAVYITGQPGCGKTSVVEQGAEQQGREYIHVHAATCLTEDFGMPMITVDDDKFGYKMPHWWPTDPESRAIICFDDLGQCPADIQKVIANIIQQRELHGHALPANVQVIATGNRQEDRAGVNRMLGHLSNRYTELEYEVNLDVTTRYWVDTDVNPSVITFCRFRPGLMQDYDPQRSANPTCRSWVEGVSDLIDVVSVEAEYECFKGAIGEGAAAEFVGFRKIERNLPDIDNLLMNPEKATVPEDPATLYAITGAIAHRVKNASFAKAIVFANRMPQEFGALMVSYACRRDESLASTQAFKDWALANQDVLW